MSPFPKRSWLGAGIIALVLVGTYLLYYPTRNMGFILDDDSALLKNLDLNGAGLLSASLKSNPFRAIPNLTLAIQAKINRPDLPPAARSLEAARRYLSEQYSQEYKMKQTLFRDPKTGVVVPVVLDLKRKLVFPLPPARPFRRMNLALHLINAGLLLLILRRLAPASAILPGLAALAFLLHPLATEPANYITARHGLLAFSFCAAAVLFYLDGDRDQWKKLAAFGFFILALLSKETAATLPLLLFLIDVGRGRPGTRVLYWLLASAAYFLIRLKWPILLGPDARHVPSTLEYLLAEQRVFWLYLAKLFLPVHQNFDYDLHPRLGLDLPALGLNAALSAGAAVVVLGPFRKKAPLVFSPPIAWAAAIWMMAWVALAPTSTLIPLADLAREERAYPLLALIIPALILGFPRRPSAPTRHLATAGLILILIAAGLLTYGRNRVWSNEYTQNRDIVSKSPEKARAVGNYGTSILYRGDMEKALSYYRLAARLDPDDPQIQEQVEIFQPLVDAMKARYSPPQNKEGQSPFFGIF